jgi:metal-responsive CopG/Arc/MetJ family transcriptional regulator
MAKRYIGINIEENTLERLKILAIMNNTDRTKLISEAIEDIFEKYSDKFDNFQEYIINLKK